MKTELQTNAFKISRLAVDQELIQLMRGPNRVAGRGCMTRALPLPFERGGNRCTGART